MWLENSLIKFNSASMLYIPVEHADDVNKLFVIPRVVVNLAILHSESPECIHSSAVDGEEFTMCFISKFKRKRLKLTDSKEKR